MLDIKHSTNEYKCYTNLNKKDRRLRCVLVYTDGHKENISYPKLIMEQYLGRKLNKNEQVHHIDENPLNNDINNLQILKLGEHQRLHSKFIEYYKICEFCKKEFLVTLKRHRNHRGKRWFCSRQCVGKYYNI